MKIWQYFRLHLKIICWRFHIKNLSLFEICAREIWEKFVYKHSETIGYVQKLAHFLRNLQTSRASNSRIHRIKNAKFSGYCFYMNNNIKGDFQICISVALSELDLWKYDLKFIWNLFKFFRTLFIYLWFENNLHDLLHLFQCLQVLLMNNCKNCKILK